MNNTYFIVVFTSFENILENESNECLTGRDEEMLHVLITHVKDYLFEKTAFFDSRRREEERQRERERRKEKRTQIHKPQKYKEHLLRINFTHTTTLSTSRMCFPLFSCVCLLIMKSHLHLCVLHPHLHLGNFLIQCQSKARGRERERPVHTW